MKFVGASFSRLILNTFSWPENSTFTAFWNFYESLNMKKSLELKSMIFEKSSPKYLFTSIYLVPRASLFPLRERALIWAGHTAHDKPLPRRGNLALLFCSQEPNRDFYADAKARERREILRHFIRRKSCFKLNLLNFKWSKNQRLIINFTSWIGVFIYSRTVSRKSSSRICWISNGQRIRGW